MSLAAIVEWLTQVNNGYDAYQTFEKHSDAAKRALSGKKPYEQSKQVEAELSKLESLTKKLDDIKAKGLGDPDKKLEWSDLLKLMKQLEGTDRERDEATKKFVMVRLSMAQLTDKGDELSDALGKIAASAAKRRDVAVDLRDQFEKLAEKIPEDTIQVMMFDCMQAFESASGALAGVASSANDAMKSIDADVAEMRKKLEKLVKAFEEALKTSDKIRKSKK